MDPLHRPPPVSLSPITCIQLQKSVTHFRFQLSPNFSALSLSLSLANSQILIWRRIIDDNSCCKGGGRGGYGGGGGHRDNYRDGLFSNWRLKTSFIFCCPEGFNSQD
ncbi:unnamed protein product [Ilex paraguariensis]|uniref:Uncharacterized protein n=1 Tax=Ilex paraguariensis TaxID=185542 RepID=A0ABC8RI22_9AQUA